MLTFFRRIRKSFLGAGKAGKYLIYAIGEIGLVMIGILLALQVNNWNEERKRKNQLKTILQVVAEDLKKDTLIASGIIKHYETNNELSLKILMNEMSRDEFKACPSCRSLTTIVKDFTIQQKGYDQLTNFIDQNSAQPDTLVTSITQFYTLLAKSIDNSNIYLRNEVLGNLAHYRSMPWFSAWTLGELNEEMVDYFLESTDHRNRIASHNVLAAKNHLLFVTVYKQNAEAILRAIERRLSVKS